MFGYILPRSSADLIFLISPQMNKAIVYIEEMDSVADVTFPAVPQVVSLLLYDNADEVKERPRPPNGYPVVCVTVSVLLLFCAHLLDSRPLPG